MNNRKPAVAFALLLTLTPLTAAAHGGGTNAQGCHTDTQGGGYHCHTPQSPDHRVVTVPEKSRPPICGTTCLTAVFVGAGAMAGVIAWSWLLPTPFADAETVSVRAFVGSSSGGFVLTW